MKIVNIDNVLEKYFKDIYKNFVYHDPESFMAKIKFQMISQDAQYYIMRVGDPGGYCAAWSMWFIETVCANINSKTSITIDYLINNYITLDRVTNMLKFKNPKKTVKTSNMYLYYIRLYAHHLDAEKNKILQEAGVDEENFYDIQYNDDTYSKLFEYFKVKEDEF